MGTQPGRLGSQTCPGGQSPDPFFLLSLAAIFLLPAAALKSFLALSLTCGLKGSSTDDLVAAGLAPNAAAPALVAATCGPALAAALPLSFAGAGFLPKAPAPACFAVLADFVVLPVPDLAEGPVMRAPLLAVAPPLLGLPLLCELLLAIDPGRYPPRLLLADVPLLRWAF